MAGTDDLDPPTEAAPLPVLASADVDEVIAGLPVVRAIGAGSTGRVFECVDKLGLSTPPDFVAGISPEPPGGRRVACKVLGAAFRDGVVVEQLRAQQQALHPVHHACLARVFAVVDHDGAPVVVEELLPGENLHARLLREGPLPPRVALRAVRDAARALGAAAAVGVSHGDVRPQNLVLHDGRTKLNDFGLGAPGSTVDVAADLRGLGRTLHLLLTGKPAGDHGEVFDRAALATAPAPTKALLLAMNEPDPALQPTFDELVQQIEDTIADKVTPKRAPKVKAPTTTAKPAPSLATPAPVAVATTPQPASPTAGTVVRRVPQMVSMEAEAVFPPSSPQTAPPFVGVPSGIMGSLKQMGVAEIVQTLELGRKTARVELFASNTVTGVFAARAGRVIYAQCGRLVGEDAFYALCVAFDGFFRIHYGEDGVDTPNITAATQHLLLESMRRVDEKAQQSATPIDAPTLASSLSWSSPSASPSAPVPPAASSDPAPASLEITEPSQMKPAMRPAPAARSGFDDSPWGDMPQTLEVTAPQKQAPATFTSHPAKKESTKEATKPAPSSSPLSTLDRLVGQRRWLLAVPVVGVVLVVVVIAAVAGSGFSLSDAIADIDAGRAQAVVDELSSPSTPEEHLARAHAEAALGKDDDALVDYGAAFPLVDGRGLSHVLKQLDKEAPDRALDLLQRWPDKAVHERLVELTADADWNRRHNAATALRERNEATDADAERVAILDLDTSPLCAARRDALIVLKDVGSSATAKAAIERAAKTKKTDNRCLANDLAAAQAAVGARAAH